MNLIKTHGQEKGTILRMQFWNFRKLYGDPSFTPDILSTIAARTLIIHGDNDEAAPVSNAWEMYKNISNRYLLMDCAQWWTYASFISGKS